MTVAHHVRDTSDHPSDLLDSEANLRHLLSTVREGLGADVVTLLQLDPASRHLVTVLTDSAVRTTAVHHRVPVGRGLAGRVAQFGHADQPGRRVATTTWSTRPSWRSGSARSSECRSGTATG